MIFDIDSDPSDLIIIFLGISSNNVDKYRQGPCRQIHNIASNTHIHVQVTGPKKIFRKNCSHKKDLRSDETLQGMDHKLLLVSAMALVVL